MHGGWRRIDDMHCCGAPCDGDVSSYDEPSLHVLHFGEQRRLMPKKSVPKSIIDRTSPEPFYLQLVRIMEEAIDTGAFNVGDKLPGESELCRRYELARSTVRETLRTLDDRRRIRIIPRRGAFVIDPEGSGYMNYKDFWKFSSQIAIILGVKSNEFLDHNSKKLFLKMLGIQVYEYEGKNNMFCFAFHDVVLALSKIAVIIKMKLSK